MSLCLCFSVFGTPHAHLHFSFILCQRARNLPAGNYTIELGLKVDGSMHSLGSFSSKNTPLQLLIDASIRDTRRVRPRAADFWELIHSIESKPPSNITHGISADDLMPTFNLFFFFCSFFFLLF